MNLSYLFNYLIYLSYTFIYLFLSIYFNIILPSEEGAVNPGGGGGYSLIRA